MNRIVEYKLSLYENGEVNHPKFIHDSGWWYDSNSKTYIGVVLSPEKRSYYVPDTLVDVSEEKLIERLMLMNKSTPFVKKDGVTQLTEDEIIQMSNEWYNTHINV